MSDTKIILDAETLAKMGIHGEAIYTIEYDLQSERKILKNATPAERKEAQARNKLARHFRNKVVHALKFNIRAYKHLESSWIVSEDRLEKAVEELSEISEEMRERGFENVEKRLKIIPILTTQEGFEHYEDRKAQFLLQFAMEHIKYIDKGLDEQRMTPSTLWRCKKAYSIISDLKEEVKNRQDLYDEITDTISLLDDKISVVEEEIAKWKAEEQEE